ncbi:MAG TPA: metallophosphoesterase, partial [Solirubrobacteraceae bacterium]
LAGEVVVLEDEVARTIRSAQPDTYDATAVQAAARQLALQGVIALTTLTEGATAFVLQVPVIERYAGALIVAAKTNPRGVPALEERLLGSSALPLPGIAPDRRLPRLDERVVLECVAELMIKHGLCVRHAGLLIFPSLFPEPAASEETLAHSVSLYYDFTGAIDNIYASLVARLMVSARFGNGRLYPGRAEFDEPDRGVCGIRQIVRRGGLGHLDLFFSETTQRARRELFAQFVAEHLREHGVVIREQHAITCRGCGRRIPEDAVQENIVLGYADVVCQYCRTSNSLSEALDQPRAPADSMVALRMEVDRRTQADSDRAKAVIAAAVEPALDEAIRVLHLSDLHFTGRTSPDAKARWLLEDLKAMGAMNVEYLVISGDITDRGNDQGFERGREFVTILNEALGVSAERCIFVPGNHDVQDLEEAFDWYGSPEKARRAEPDEVQWHREGGVVLVPNADRYPQRLRAFSDAFFHKVMQRPYPLEHPQQGIPYLFPGTGIQFLTLNSCWQIDQFHRRRAGVHPEAIAHLLSAAQRQVADAVEAGSLAASAPILRIAVWHHAVQHADGIRNTEFATNLQKAGVRLALHGDVHELTRDRFRYWHDDGLHVIGSGSFASPPEGRPESTPRLYNVLEISGNRTAIRVHTRRQQTPDGAWEGYNEWPLS